MLFAVLACAAGDGWGQAAVATAGWAPAAGALPATAPLNTKIFPLSEIRRGQRGVAYTVFEGVVPEPMEVEILGVLKDSLGPGQDMILAKLHGTKPEYTGVVAGMSGSPVYIDGRLVGALSYRIGQFDLFAALNMRAMDPMRIPAQRSTLSSRSAHRSMPSTILGKGRPLDFEQHTSRPFDYPSFDFPALSTRDRTDLGHIGLTANFVRANRPTRCALGPRPTHVSSAFQKAQHFPPTIFSWYLARTCTMDRTSRLSTAI